MPNINVDAHRAVRLLTDVAKSIKDQDAGVSSGHMYLKIRNDQLEAAMGSEGKVSFATVSSIFEQVMATKGLTAVEKHEALLAYKIIAKKHEKSETKLYTWLFGNKDVQKEQSKLNISSARDRESKEKEKIVKLKNYIAQQASILAKNPSDDDVKHLMYRLGELHQEAIAHLDLPQSEITEFDRVLGRIQIRRGLKLTPEHKRQALKIIASIKECLDTKYELNGVHKDIRKQDIINLKSYVDGQIIKLGNKPSDDDVKQLMWRLRHDHAHVIEKLDQSEFEKNRWLHESFSRQMKPEVKLTPDQKQVFLEILHSIKNCLNTKYEANGQHKPVADQPVIVSGRAKQQRKDIIKLKDYVNKQYFRLAEGTSDRDRDELKKVMQRIKGNDIIGLFNWSASDKRKFEAAAKLEGTSGIVSSGTYKTRYTEPERQQVLNAIKLVKEHLEKNFGPDGQPHSRVAAHSVRRSAQPKLQFETDYDYTARNEAYDTSATRSKEQYFIKELKEKIISAHDLLNLPFEDAVRRDSKKLNDVMTSLRKHLNNSEIKAMPREERHRLEDCQRKLNDFYELPALSEDRSRLKKEAFLAIVQLRADLGKYGKDGQRL